MLSFCKKISFLMIMAVPFLAYGMDENVSFREGGARGGFNRGAQDRNFDRGRDNRVGEDNFHRDNLYVNPYGNAGGTTVIVPGQTDYQYQNQLYNQNQPNQR